MALASGLDSQFGFVQESTFGTYETPTRFLEFTEESLKLSVQRIESAGLKAGRRVLHRWNAGVREVAGDVTYEVAPQGAGLLWLACLGANTTSGVGPYTHTITPGDLSDDFYTLQINRPDISGTDRVFSYLGCSVTGWEMSARVNEYAMLKVSWYGQAEDTGQSLASASYPSGYAPFTWDEMTLSIASSDYCVREVTLTGDNGLATGRHFICATSPTLPKQAVESGLRDYSGSFVGDFEDLTAYNRFVNGTEAALVLTGSDATHSITITTNVRFDGETPNVRGPEILEQPIQFKCVSSTSDAAAITVAVVNADSAV